MTAAEFIAKWSDATLRERQGSQEHFLDLCRLLEQPTPAADDPHGDRYCFERGATKAGGGDGWADVWRRGCFGWEYKGPHKDLNAAFRQLSIYASALENPPYLVVSDMVRIVIHTNWTNTVSQVIELSLEDLREPAKLALLRQVFEGSDKLKPGISPQDLTAKVAARFGDLGRRLQDRGHDPREVAHFLNQLVFCMFAEDARLLPEGLFTRVVRATEKRPDLAADQLSDLFTRMHRGGFFGADVIRWFNGGLFDGAAVLPLESTDLKLIGDTAAEHDWSEIDPAVFGTLFEEALKATRKRAALGAHYTDRAKILKIVEPVVIWPLSAEWDAALAEIKAHAAAMTAADDERRAILEAAGAEMKVDPAAARAGESGRRKKVAAIVRRKSIAFGAAQARLEGYLGSLAAYRVLDPACGSGNFLYVALQALKDLELKAIVDAERAAGIPQQTPRVGLDNVRGIEIEPYAAELARVTLWIGDLQWMKRNGFTGWSEPILSNLAQIENRDALLNEDGTEAAWPEADAIIGNPPFLGDKKMIADIGEDYVATLRKTYLKRVPGGADFVTYWIEKAWRAVDGNFDRRAGLVTTNSVRNGASRKVLDPIASADAIWDAWSDEDWVLDGAAVRVSMVAFGSGFIERRLQGTPVRRINSDLTSGSVDLTKRAVLKENENTAFVGVILNGDFEVPGDLARRWLRSPANVNGRPNSDVLRPTLNGDDFNGDRPDKWVIDFGTSRTEAEAAQYELPFAAIESVVKPYRQRLNSTGGFALRADNERIHWWRHARPRPAMRQALSGLGHYIATPMVSSYRTFGFLSESILPDQKLIAFSKADMTFFGILESVHHRVWTLRTCSWIGAGNDVTYAVSSTYQTFAFPEGLTPNIPASNYAADPRARAIAEAASELNRLRELWLNPPQLVRVEPEVAPGYPDRVVPIGDEAARVLKTRTLTDLYSERRTWLDLAHRQVDEAVAAAYGWSADLSDDEILERLLRLNQERSSS
ncbi:class I SAM-dependent DNA methyltransferase [Phenylobacterium ferrooxidans]|uniref:site-specific DNA-methyltransferase (adenine-specific) n=1 Tax=Phenylobacterium ferrooxidans TaxID=2982689 RepID=A0ABW6CJU7_9CAUL